jgi:hypothetical protein
MMQAVHDSTAGGAYNCKDTLFLKEEKKKVWNGSHTVFAPYFHIRTGHQMHRAGKASNTPVNGSFRVASSCTSWASLADVEQDCNCNRAAGDF